MAISVNINGTTYSIPTQGQSPPWGEDLTALLEALVDAVNSTTGSADILLTSFNVANSVAVAANVTGASFDSSQVRSAIISYSAYRSTTTNELSECGQIYITYSSLSATWDLSQNYTGSSGLVFTITPGGQIQYTSSTVAGLSYAGKLKFSAKAFLQT